MAGAWQAYVRLLHKFPIRMHALTTGTLMAAGDGISQMVVERKPIREYDAMRGARFFGFGFILAGPMLGNWFRLLDRLYKGAGPKTAILKMVTDQSIMAPTFLTSFISIMGLMTGDTINEVKDKLNTELWPILMVNYRIWPAVQLCNFFFVPLNHRVLVVNVTLLGWSTYLAWKAEQMGKAKAAASKAIEE